MSFLHPDNGERSVKPIDYILKKEPLVSCILITLKDRAMILVVSKGRQLTIFSPNDREFASDSH
jgi:hypothetical protein